MSLWLDEMAGLRIRQELHSSTALWNFIKDLCEIPRGIDVHYALFTESLSFQRQQGRCVKEACSRCFFDRIATSISFIAALDRSKYPAHRGNGIRSLYYGGRWIDSGSLTWTCLVIQPKIRGYLCGYNDQRSPALRYGPRCAVTQLSSALFCQSTSNSRGLLTVIYARNLGSSATWRGTESGPPQLILSLTSLKKTKISVFLIPIIDISIRTITNRLSFKFTESRQCINLHPEASCREPP
ncbi:uncharacterized protein ARMOST_08087 [Armillaria ostoyae]|uniref:Uncharacterized protein n=1 Tax=Armillaria ostoyae TaxID=47428 RepID=A0A284R7M4_ARMOS|nr:uncharacterized protein ARMOST_08087 [Armillaria ostoyae]